MSQALPAENTVSLAEVLLDLGRGNFAPEHLLAFSDLSKENRKIVNTAWPLLPEPVRLKVISAATELAEQNVLYDFERLFRIGLADNAAEVRRRSIAGLWEADSGDLLDRFLDILNQDDSELVRQESALALAKYCDLVQAGTLSDSDAERLTSSLMSVADDPDESLWLRRRALESVSVIDNSPEVEDLILQAFEADDDAIRAGALYAMGRRGGRQYLPDVMNEMASDANELRFEAVRAAGAIGDDQALPLLIDLLADPDREVREAAVIAIGAIGGVGAVRTLRNLQQEPGDIDSDAVEDALDRALVTSDPLSGLA